MNNAEPFRDKIRQGELCLGTVISFMDPTVTESLCNLLDFIWIDMEHNALTLEAVQGHILTTKGTKTTPIVRVPWNDPVLIKPVLDIGAAGIIAPMVRTADEARRAVAACRYPPDGIRGFGPRRPSNYGRLGGPDFCRAANESVIVICQIEHIDAVNNIDEILAVPGLTSIVFGPQDLSGSMGLMGNPRHPDVLRAIDHVIERALRTDIPIGMSIGPDPVQLSEWADKGVHWLAMGNDYSLLLRATTQVKEQVLQHAAAKH